MMLCKQGMVVVAMMGLVACSAQGPLKTYEGPARAVSEVALVSVPEQIEIMSVDGHEPPPSFLKSNVELSLLPGEHVFSLRYVELFQITSEEHDVVRSRPAALRFTAKAGAAYKLEVPRQANHDVASAFAKEPHFNLVNSQDGGVTESVFIKSYAEASLIDTISKAFTENQAADPVTNLDLLKDVWTRTTPEERSAFRMWLDQQGK